MRAVDDIAEVLTALRGGPATLDALDARLGGTDRETLLWAVREATRRGLVTGSGSADCGPDGRCASTAPTVCRLTPAGATAARAAVAVAAAVAAR